MNKYGQIEYSNVDRSIPTVSQDSGFVIGVGKAEHGEFFIIQKKNVRNNKQKFILRSKPKGGICLLLYSNQTLCMDFQGKKVQAVVYYGDPTSQTWTVQYTSEKKLELEKQRRAEVDEEFEQEQLRIMQEAEEQLRKLAEEDEKREEESRKIMAEREKKRREENRACWFNFRRLQEEREKKENKDRERRKKDILIKIGKPFVLRTSETSGYLGTSMDLVMEGNACCVTGTKTVWVMNKYGQIEYSNVDRSIPTISQDSGFVIGVRKAEHGEFFIIQKKNIRNSKQKFILRSKPKGGVCLVLYSNQTLCMDFQGKKVQAVVYYGDPTSQTWTVQYTSEKKMGGKVVKEFDGTGTVRNDVKPEKCLVSFDFEPKDNEELGSKAGETLTVLHDHGDWLKCENEKGDVGFIPRNFVETIGDHSQQNDCLVM